MGNVDNTSDINKPISNATQTALDGKQDVLVSGTNIKTINGQTILGEGDITIESGSGVGKVDPNSDGTGEVFNDYTNNVATGSYAHAEGFNTEAKGKGSHAEGCALNDTYGNYAYIEAVEDGSHAGGYAEGIGNILSKGLGSFAHGYSNDPINGEGISASGNGAFAGGYITIAGILASGNGAFAWGGFDLYNGT